MRLLKIELTRLDSIEFVEQIRGGINFRLRSGNYDSRISIGYQSRVFQTLTGVYIEDSAFHYPGVKVLTDPPTKLGGRSGYLDYFPWRKV